MTSLILISIIVVLVLIVFPSKRKPIKQEENSKEKSQKLSLQELRDCLDQVVFIDTETSSLEVDAGEVLQLSAVKLKDITEEGEFTLSTFNEYIKPSDKIRIDLVSMKINKISLAQCIKPKDEVFREFLEFCKGRTIISGYNVSFDINMLEDDMSKEGFSIRSVFNDCLDVLEEVRNDYLPIPNNKLSTVATYYGLKCDKYHDSLVDCLATVFVHLKHLGYNIDINNLCEQIVSDNNNYISKQSISTKESTKLFSGKNVCISGYFAKIRKEDLEKLIIESGGILKRMMSGKVDIFIDGFNLSPTAKEEKFAELIKNGHSIIKYEEEDLIQQLLINS